MSTENNSELLYDNSVQILTHLIAFKTISGEDNSSLIDYCDDILKKLGATSFRTYDDEKKRVNLFATLKARKPSLVIEVDFGKEIGVKKSSAQITHYYNEDNLVGKQIIGVCNFPKKNIAGIVSEVLILGAIEKDGKVVLVHPSQKVENGLEIA